MTGVDLDFRFSSTEKKKKFSYIKKSSRRMFC